MGFDYPGYQISHIILDLAPIFEGTLTLEMILPPPTPPPKEKGNKGDLKLCYVVSGLSWGPKLSYIHYIVDYGLVYSLGLIL